MPEGLPQTVRTELDRIASAAAVCFAGLPGGALLAAMALLCQRIAEETNEIHEAANARTAPSSSSDRGTTPGATAAQAPETSLGLPDALKPVPVPQEILADAIRTFDSKEVAEAIREIRAGEGRKLEDFLPELERAATGQ